MNTPMDEREAAEVLAADLRNRGLIPANLFCAYEGAIEALNERALRREAPREGPVECAHAPYLGACIHCGCGFRDGRPVWYAPLAGRSPRADAIHAGILASLRGDCNPNGGDYDRRICDALDRAIALLRRDAPREGAGDARARELAAGDHVEFDTLPEQHKDEYRALAAPPSAAPQRSGEGRCPKCGGISDPDYGHVGEPGEACKPSDASAAPAAHRPIYDGEFNRAMADDSPSDAVGALVGKLLNEIRAENDDPYITYCLDQIAAALTESTPASKEKES